MSTNAARLAAAVAARRDELDKTQLEISAAGGPSNTLLTRIEGGQMATLERQTARKLDRGLRWEPGSARAVWSGEGQPEPARASTLIRYLIEHTRTADLAESTRERVLRVLEDDLAAALKREGGETDGRDGPPIAN